ncbi:DUF2285 domain-containing protein [Dongia sedimenti]|uniref:DUF2285 domain-containing protein n=1 Tax=Dongia sedimenti TaxID=3064282 RepID=UPI0036D2FA41
MLDQAKALWVGTETLHLLWGQGHGSLQVRIRWFASDGPASLSAELPTTAAAYDAWLSALRRLSCLRSTTKADHGFAPDPRGSRFSTLLCALDGSLAGKTHREIAAALVGPARVEADWQHPGQHLRDRVRRAVKRGCALMNGRYLALLR